MPQTNKPAKSKASKEYLDHFQSLYAKRQRRRAEAIIAATGCYSAAFRAEVQQALDTAPFKLPVLFHEADEIDQKLATAGRSVRAEYKKAGIPLGNSERDITGPNRPLNRSRKNVTVRLADEIESLLIERKNDYLDENTADRAQLISDILYDISNEAGVDATHPQLVKGYVLAIFDKLNELDQHSYKTVQRAFADIRDLMSGSLCSEARFEEIDRQWNSFLYKDDETQKEVPAEIEADIESAEIVTRRKKLAKLERLPENEAIKLQLESEIYQLEREAVVNEWPDVIGGAR